MAAAELRALVFGVCMNLIGTIDVELVYASNPPEMISIDCSKFSWEDGSKNYPIFVYFGEGYKITIQTTIDRSMIVGNPEIIEEITDDKEIRGIRIVEINIKRELNMNMGPFYDDD